MTDLNQKIADTSATLARIAAEFSPAVFASSLAAEDMVLTDLILKAKLGIGIFSLETGRLHKETLDMLERVKQHYDGYEIALYRPQAEAVEGYVAQHGLNAFYDSVEMRRECCRIRKVEPLAALWPATRHGSPASAAPSPPPAPNCMCRKTIRPTA